MVGAAFCRSHDRNEPDPAQGTKESRSMLIAGKQYEFNTAVSF